MCVILHTGWDHRQVDKGTRSCSEFPTSRLAIVLPRFAFLSQISAHVSRIREINAIRISEHWLAGTGALHNSCLWIYNASYLLFSWTQHIARTLFIFKSTVFWNVMPCHKASVVRKCCTFSEMFKPIPDFMTSHPRRWYSSITWCVVCQFPSTYLLRYGWF
jgi:hypothetical protein